MILSSRVGKFKAPGSLETKRGQQESLTEIAASLLNLEGEKIDVVKDAEAGKTKLISEKHLDELLRRKGLGHNDLVHEPAPAVSGIQTAWMMSGTHCSNHASVIMNQPFSPAVSPHEFSTL